MKSNEQVQKLFCLLLKNARWVWLLHKVWYIYLWGPEKQMAEALLVRHNEVRSSVLTGLDPRDTSVSRHPTGDGLRRWRAPPNPRDQHPSGGKSLDRSRVCVFRYQLCNHLLPRHRNATCVLCPVPAGFSRTRAPDLTDRRFSQNSSTEKDRVRLRVW